MPRIFIGIKMSKKIEDLATNWSSDKLNWPVRWIKPKNLHLTLIPPFYEDNIEMITDKLKTIPPLAGAIGINFHTISYGPGPGNYRLIWAVGNPSLELEKLKVELEKSLNLKSEARRFLPHLTLARFRPEDFSKLRVKILNEKINWDEEIRTFTIFKSILRPDGAEYEVIKSF